MGIFKTSEVAAAIIALVVALVALFVATGADQEVIIDGVLGTLAATPGDPQPTIEVGTPVIEPTGTPKCEYTVGTFIDESDPDATSYGAPYYREPDRGTGIAGYTPNGETLYPEEVFYQNDDVWALVAGWYYPSTANFLFMDNEACQDLLPPQPTHTQVPTPIFTPTPIPYEPVCYVTPNTDYTNIRAFESIYAPIVGRLVGTALVVDYSGEWIIIGRGFLANWAVTETCQ